MIRLWPGLFVAPLVFLAELSLAYALVPYACASQRHGVLHAVQLAALGLALAGAAHAWMAYRRAGTHVPEDAGDVGARDRFLALVGTLSSATVALALLAQWLTTWFVPPCVR